MLSKKELNVLNGLLEKKDFKGKKDLRALIWLNTSTPKFQIGDIVTVTDRSMYICEQQVINWTGLIKEIYSVRFENAWHYRIEVHYFVNGKQRSATVSSNESGLRKTDHLEIKAFNYDGKYEECIAM